MGFPVKLVVALLSIFSLPLFAQLELGGVVEFEATLEEIDQKNESSYGLGAVEIGAVHEINDKTNAEIVLVYQSGDEDTFEVDTGIINMALIDEKAAMTFGKGVLPLGEFNSQLVSDSMVLELAETNAAFANLNYSLSFMDIDLWLTNSASGKRKNGENYGFKLTTGNDQRSLKWNAYYALQNDIAISGGLADLESERKVAGSLLGFDIAYHNATLVWEYFFTNESFESEILSFQEEGAKPDSYSLELGISSTLFNKEANYAIRFEQSTQASELELPKRKVTIGFNSSVNENLALALEGSLKKDYSVAEGGTNREDKGLLTQLAYNF